MANLEIPPKDCITNVPYSQIARKRFLELATIAMKLCESLEEEKVLPHEGCVLWQLIEHMWQLK
jgi:hypothetical protein